VGRLAAAGASGTTDFFAGAELLAPDSLFLDSPPAASFVSALGCGPRATERLAITAAPDATATSTPSKATTAQRDQPDLALSAGRLSCIQA
jgi:hypothetical protein